jgi:hypothetical protein
MRHQMKWLTAIALCAGMALPASPAQAKDPGPNGQIAFSRYVQDDNTVTYTANPDGTHIRRLFPGFSGGPRWSPDGSQVSIFAACTDGEENCAATIVDPDTGTFRQFKWPDPTLVGVVVQAPLEALRERAATIGRTSWAAAGSACPSAARSAWRATSRTPAPGQPQPARSASRSLNGS